MAKPMRPRAPDVVISDHAHHRWLERVNRPPKRRTALAALIETVLYARLASGVIMTGLSVTLDMGNGINAVLRLTDAAWVCTTVIDTTEPREVG